MKVMATGLLPIGGGNVSHALNKFVEIVRTHFDFDAQTRCTLFSSSSSPAPVALIARSVPSDAGEFHTALSTTKLTRQA